MPERRLAPGQGPSVAPAAPAPGRGICGSVGAGLLDMITSRRQQLTEAEVPKVTGFNFFFEFWGDGSSWPPATRVSFPLVKSRKPFSSLK